MAATVACMLLGVRAVYVPEEQSGAAAVELLLCLDPAGEVASRVFVGEMDIAALQPPGQ